MWQVDCKVKQTVKRFKFVFKRWINENEKGHPLALLNTDSLLFYILDQPHVKRYAEM